jgi:hypothetical protein
MMRSTAFERRMLFERAGEHHPSPDLLVAANDRTSIVPQA